MRSFHELCARSAQYQEERTKYHAMKTYLGSTGTAAPILNLGTRWGWVVNSRSGRFTPGVRTHGTHWIGSWVGPRSDIDI